jgi:5-formyltetrahydrofolate cyclo-ligase
MRKLESSGSLKSLLRHQYRRERHERFMEESWLHILGASEFADVKIVASYHSYGDEPGTSDINQELIKRGVTVVLPKLLPDNDLEWVRWDGSENSLAAHGKVLEPQGFAFTDLHSIGIAIVPALHIDRSGNRLGQGGGSYDRALAKLSCWKIALVHHGELTSDPLPVDDHDQKVDAAATPDLIARFSSL